MGGELLWTAAVRIVGVALGVLDVLVETLSVILYAITAPLRFMLYNSAIHQPAQSCSPVRVVIIGASFAGLAAARSLRSSWAARTKQMRIILVEARDYFEYTPGILRTFVEPAAASRLCCMLPARHYDEVIRGYVTKISAEHITVSTVAGHGAEDGEADEIEVYFDYCILASGASYAEPVQQGRHSEHALTLSGRKAELRAHAQRLKASPSVIIVGGGPVGVELAAEIASHYRTGVKKEITILTSSNTLLGPVFTDKTIDYCTTWLIDHGVNIRYLERASAIDKGSVTLANGEVFRADLVYDCTGGSANSDSLVDCEGAASGSRRRVLVNEFLQVKNEFYMNRLFAAGDVMEADGKPDVKLAFTAEIGGHLAAHNVAAAIKGKELHPYPKGIVGGDKVPTVYCVSLGKSDGSLGFQTITINGVMAGFVKWVIESTKMLCIRERVLGMLIWGVGDNVAFFFGRTLFKKKSS